MKKVKQKFKCQRPLKKIIPSGEVGSPNPLRSVGWGTWLVLYGLKCQKMTQNEQKPMFFLSQKSYCCCSVAVLLSVSICESRVGRTSHVLELSGLSEIWRLLLRLLSDNSDLLEELTKRVWGYVLLFFSEKNPCPPPSHTSCHHCSNAYSDNMHGGGGSVVGQDGFKWSWWSWSNLNLDGFW